MLGLAPKSSENEVEDMATVEVSTPVYSFQVFLSCLAKSTQNIDGGSLKLAGHPVFDLVSLGA